MNQTIEKRRFTELIRAFDFRTLFNELGWDFTNQKQIVSLDGFDYELNMIAEKRGFVIFSCRPDATGKIPQYDVRRKIDNRLSKLHFEHLIIYTDTHKTQQVWQVVIRESGRPVLPREVTFYTHQDPQLLYQKLSGLFFSLDEEDKIGIVDVHARVAEAFNENAEKVTKKFFDQFKKEHADFKEFIEGISQDSDTDWYTSIMLNRLMFIYFIQKKGFLDYDINYLRTKLRETQQKKGEDQYYSFYRNFLRVLFHQGLGAPEHSPELIREIGQIPYLNGGLFDVHKIEKDYPDIQIKDRAFEQIFNFFDEWNWHLDTRVSATGKDINPDVLGYVYEKYINQKQMGAYYTKEDITGYISQNTIIPCLFDKAREKCKIAFEGEHTFWKLLQNDPDRYIYDAVKKGVEKPLPPEIEIGVDTSQPNLIERRKEWNKPAPEEYALPTEIWREVVARRQRYTEVWEKLVNGDIHEINDFITYNLDIKQFASDVIVNCEGSDLLKAFWESLKEISILDPTVGSGAFLFAALNILESLYEAGLDRMQAFLNELDNSGEKHRSDKYGHFKQVLAQIEKHPNRRYFIFKSIIVNNLYGVDIMEEAVEICRLRLFLKLVAETDVDYAKPNMGLEPLPDIDFNIKAGNSLVGFATYEETRKSVEGVHQLELGFVDYMKVIDEKAEACALAYDHFKALQIEGETAPGEIARAKADLQSRLTKLDDELNQYLAIEYGKKPEKKSEYEKWLKSHQPFHWFVEFYGIVHQKGGFDVIIGNPPYVEYSKVTRKYSIHGYKTETCGNLYAFILERSLDVLRNHGKISMIIPLASFSTARMKPLQELYEKYVGNLFLGHYEATSNPSTLFMGVKIQLTILVADKVADSKARVLITNYRRAFADERPFLFDRTVYCPVIKQNGHFARVLQPIEHRLLIKIFVGKHTLQNILNVNKGCTLWYRNMGNFFFKLAFLNEPTYEKDGSRQKSSTTSPLVVRDDTERRLIIAIINSTLFYYYWILFSDCYHLSKSDIVAFPISIGDMSQEHKNQLYDLCGSYLDSLEKHAVWQREMKSNGTEKRYRRYFPQSCKPIIDEIDRVLAEHYGFTEEELDYIINYDIKYRMGKEV